MFSNPGNKMKIFGIVTFILNTIVLTALLIIAIISFVSLMKYNSNYNYYSSYYGSYYDHYSSTTNTIATWGIIGSIISYLIMEVFNYILCMFIISFGELVQNSTDILYYVKGIANKDGAQTPMPALPVAPYVPNVQIKICPKCGTENSANDSFCCNCGTRLP